MDYFDEKNYVLVSGFAQTPKGTPLNEIYKSTSAILLVDKRTHCVINSDFCVVSPLTREVLQKLIQGYCLAEPFENWANKVKNLVTIPSLEAILQAAKSAIKRYKDTYLTNE
ncbi:MAG: DUF3870 domain-containing protein [Dehalobacterium sp.]